MSEHFVIESDRRVVGIAVRVPGGFKFFASDTDFLEIEGRIFPRVNAINHRIRQINESRRITPAFVRHAGSSGAASPDSKVAAKSPARLFQAAR